jgi:hypothetical protein
MVKYCVAALLMMLAWLWPAPAWASPSTVLLAQAPGAEVAEAAASGLGDDEIATFAKAYQAVQTLRIRAEGDMAKAVEDEGLTVDRFNAIAETQLDGPAQTADDMAKVAAKAKISKGDKKKFDAAVERIIAIRQSAEGEMETAIEAEGLSIDSFNRLLEQSADDTDLQRRISDAIVKQTLSSAKPQS